MKAKITRRTNKKSAAQVSNNKNSTTKTRPWSYTAATIANGVDGYLVVWRHTMDDVPVGLFKTEKAALDAAKNMTFKVGYSCAARVDINCGTPVCFAVIQFSKGIPGKMTIVERKDDAV